MITDKFGLRPPQNPLFVIDKLTGSGQVKITFLIDLVTIVI